jgi:hypothetical protein
MMHGTTNIKLYIEGCVCMYVCMYVCLCMCMHVRICLCMYVCMYIWGNALQTGRSRIRFLLGFFSYLILLAALWLWRRVSLWEEWLPRIFPGGKGGRCVGLTTLPPSRADCLEILGNRTSWSPKDLYRSERGNFTFALIRTYIYIHILSYMPTYTYVSTHTYTYSCTLYG